MNTSKKTLFLFVFVILFFLTSCAANVAATGAQAVYNRHNIKSTLDDQYITMKAERSLYLDSDRYKNTNVTTATFNGVVLLAGQVPTPAQKVEIENKVRKIEGIKELHNLIAISVPTSALTRASDAWITAKVKSKLIAMNDIDPSQIKVVTENGTVYLMGIVPHDQADIAVDLARTTDGVQNVVKVLKYITISRT